MQKKLINKNLDQINRLMFNSVDYKDFAWGWNCVLRNEEKNLGKLKIENCAGLIIARFFSSTRNLDDINYYCSLFSAKQSSRKTKNKEDLHFFTSSIFNCSSLTKENCQETSPMYFVTKFKRNKMLKCLPIKVICWRNDKFTCWTNSHPSTKRST